MSRPALVGLFSVLVAFAAARAATPAYTISRSIPLGAPDKWDYVVFDAASGHVLVAHGDHTDIINPRTGRTLGTLGGIQGAHGEAVVPGSGLIYADSGKTASIGIYDGANQKLIKTLPAGQDADGVIYEPTQHLIVVMDGDAAAVTLIDTLTQTVRATIKLGGQPEFGVADAAGHIYVNLASTRQIAVIDAARATLAKRYDIPSCESPHGLAVDPKTRRLFASCRNDKLLVVDADRGTVLQTLPIGRGTDAAAFDPVHHLVFSSNGSGTLSVMAEQADGSLARPAEVPTAAGARTLATDPGTGRVFLVTADASGTGRDGKTTFKSGTVKLLVLEPVTK